MKAVYAFMFAFCLAGCALLREGNPVTTPAPGVYPCGVNGDVCLDARTPEERCCLVGKCISRDDDRFCDNRPPSDPSNPIFLSAKYRTERSSAQ